MKKINMSWDSVCDSALVFHTHTYVPPLSIQYKILINLRLDRLRERPSLHLSLEPHVVDLQGEAVSVHGEGYQLSLSLYGGLTDWLLPRRPPDFPPPAPPTRQHQPPVTWLQGSGNLAWCRHHYFSYSLSLLVSYQQTKSTILEEKISIGIPTEWSTWQIR